MASGCIQWYRWKYVYLWLPEKFLYIPYRGAHRRETQSSTPYTWNHLETYATIASDTRQKRTNHYISNQLSKLPQVPKMGASVVSNGPDPLHSVACRDTSTLKKRLIWTHLVELILQQPTDWSCEVDPSWQRQSSNSMALSCWRSWYLACMQSPLNLLSVDEVFANVSMPFLLNVL